MSNILKSYVVQMYYEGVEKPHTMQIVAYSKQEAEEILNECIELKLFGDKFIKYSNLVSGKTKRGLQEIFDRQTAFIENGRNR